MEALKKIAVLVTGVMIIGLVIWVLALTGDQLGGDLKTRENSFLQKNSSDQSTDKLQTIEPSQTVVAPEERRKNDRRESIRWRSEENAPTPETPKISGKMPFMGNPNQVFVRAAQRILPAVVSIESSRRVKSGSFDFFHPFLNREDDEKKDDEEEHIQPGSGSGILISTDGYVMTNFHVVEEAAELRVKLYDKREFPATVVGTDPTTDLSIVKIDAENLPAAFMGNSDSVQIGEWVMAVGNPLNFTSTVTSGIVSALGRNINIIDGRRYRYKIENFIQTDAVINPGNSGGALVNLKGEVVGINTAIATRSGFYQGYGFAIPVNLAKKVANDLIEFGRVRRAILGVSIEAVSDQIAKAEGLPKPTGAYIQSVSSDSPAKNVGIRQGDIVLSVNGSEVVSVNDLQTKIAQHRPGDVVRLIVWRDGEEWDVDVELGEAPASGQPSFSQNQSKPGKPLFENLGITLRDLTDEEKTALQVEDGLYIDAVEVGSPASKAGVYSTGVLVSINVLPVKSVEAFEKMIDESKSGVILRLKVKYANINENRILYVEVP